jgi:hypothetical protein
MKQPNEIPQIMITPTAGPLGVLLSNEQFFKNVSRYHYMTAAELDEWVNRSIREAYTKGALDARREIAANWNDFLVSLGLAR